jgi:hypothetical protein
MVWMNASVRGWIPGFGGSSNSPGGHCAVRAFDEIDLLEDRRQKTGDLGSREVEEGVVAVH